MANPTDSERVQQMVDRAVSELNKLKEIAARLQALRTEFNASRPDVTGTALQGKLAALNAWIDTVEGAAADPAANSLAGGAGSA